MSLDKISKSRIWPALWHLFARAFALLGLPLLAWGVDDVVGFLAHPARQAYALVALAQILIFTTLVYRMPPAREREYPIDQAHWQMDMFEYGFILAIFGDRRDILAWADLPALRWLGLGIYLLGAILAIWANLTWVRHLRREKENALEHPVFLSSGPYRWIRHPGLLAILTYSLGYVFIFRSWSALALWLPLAAGFLHRIQTAERGFAELFGADWAERCRASKRIIPFWY
jgi:protein-S-isoprenylcysteine O-methyltransferase Ste14